MSDIDTLPLDVLRGIASSSLACLLSAELVSNAFGGLISSLVCFLLLDFGCLPFFYSVFLLLNDGGITTRSVNPQRILCCCPGVHIRIFTSRTKAITGRIRGSVCARWHGCKDERGMCLDLKLLKFKLARHMPCQNRVGAERGKSSYVDDQM